MSILSPDEYAAGITLSLDQWDARRERSQQTAVGISDVGVCHERTRRVYLGMPETDSPPNMAAIRGTAMDIVLKQARPELYPHIEYQAEVHLSLPEASRVAGHPVVLLGHPDEIDPIEPSVNDYKTKDDAGYVKIKRHGSGQQERWQRHAYYAAALGDGLLTDPNGVVRNVWIDVTGRHPDPYVEQEPFDPGVIREIDLWVADVVYAAKHGEEALKDKWFDWCADYCPFFTDCRKDALGWVDEPILDPEVDEAAVRFHDAKAERKVQEALERDARVTLDVYRPKVERMRAFTTASGYRVRHKWVNESPSQSAHWRLEVTAPGEGTK